MKEIQRIWKKTTKVLEKHPDYWEIALPYQKVLKASLTVRHTGNNNKSQILIAVTEKTTHAVNQGNAATA